MSPPNRVPSFTAGEIAAKLAANVEGDANAAIRAVADLESAGATDLTWAVAENHVLRLASSRAGAALLAERFPKPPTLRAAIRVRDVELALGEVLTLFAPPAYRVAPGIDRTARVGEGVVLGADVAIGPNAVIESGATVGARTQLHAGVVIGPGATIGDDCTLWPNVIVRERCRVGARVIIHCNSVIGADGFGYLQRGGRNIKVPQIGTVEIGDDVEIGACTCIDRAKVGVTRVARGAKIDNLVQVGHNCVLGEDCVIVAQVGLSGSCKVGKNAVLAGQVGVGDHVEIAERAIVLAQSGVSKDMPAGAVWSGTLARDHREQRRLEAVVRKLPAFMEEMRELVRRIERLEASANDSTRS